MILTIIQLFFLSSFAQVNPEILAVETYKRTSRVHEFRFIQTEANKIGIKVYLFGGTASAFAHYVRWDLERESGDNKYQLEKFDYDFTNIYRSNQDLDLVIDGSETEMQVLKNLILKEYPYLIGDKEAWDIRLLRQENSDKLPLLDNYDFLNQHTDTNSTGLIAVNPDSDQIVFRDLFDWDNPNSKFLNDIADARIRFLYSNNHYTTLRYKQGKNPPIFSALRYLSKLAQYELKVHHQDHLIVENIVKSTDWSTLSNYVKHKLGEFALKTLLNSPNSEYAWNLLENFGLRQKLIQMDGNKIDTVSSLSWWLNKEPLRSSELGKGSGKTVLQINKEYLENNDLFTTDGDLIVSHETSDLRYYENITRSSRGEANVFISRANVTGEAALFGDGFYTQLGRYGAKGTGITIRFKLNNKAKEGTDFIKNGSYIIVKNKKALTLIQENINISLIDFLKLIELNILGPNDKGLLEKLERKFKRLKPNSNELLSAFEFVKRSYLIVDNLPSTYLNLKFKIDGTKEFSSYNNLLKKFQLNPSLNLLIKIYKSKENFFLALIEKKFRSPLMSYSKHVLLGNMDRKELMELEFNIVKNLLNINNESIQRQLLAYIYSGYEWSKRSDLIELAIEGNNLIIAEHFSRYVLPYRKADKNHLNLIKLLLEKNNTNINYLLAYGVLGNLDWIDYPELVLKLITSKDDMVDSTLDHFVFSKEHWTNHKLLKAYLNGKTVSVINLRERIHKIQFSDWLANQNNNANLCLSFLNSENL